MNKLMFGFAGALAGVSMMTSAHAGSHGCGEVSVGSMGWASGETISAIAAFLMEAGYGCEVQLVPTDTVPAVTSLAENNEPDVVPEVWKNSATVYAELEEAGKVVTAAQVFANGGEEGWWVPKYLADEHPELTTIEGVLANPDLVGGRFHNCPVGWGCRIVNDSLKVVFELEDNGIEVFDHGSGANLAASIAAAYQDEKPWFGYYWGPTAVLGKYPMTKVTLGEVNPEVHSCNQQGDCPDIGVSDFPSAPVLTAVTSSFAAENPAIADMMSKMVFPNDVVSALLAWKDDNNATADEAAAYFLQTYPDLWTSWISEDAKAKLSSLM